IREYCGSGYTDINNLLLGRYNPERYDVMSEKEIESAINNLDSAFENGDRIPEGITVYRAQSMTAPIYEALVKNKVFYFRNFVSTS
ncbi:ADP-ribosyltransferase, partial [Escherichia coli]